MNRRDYYREMAIDCLDLAAEVPNRAEAEALMQMADNWIQLADSVAAQEPMRPRATRPIPRAEPEIRLGRRRA